MEPTPTQPSPRHSLMTLRIIWFALLMGQVIFLAIVLWLIRQPGQAAEPQVRRTLFIIAAVMLATAIPVGYFLRMRLYERGRESDGSVSPGAYGSGNIIFYALCEGPSLFAIVGILLSREPMPFIILTLVAMAAQAVNFPTGAPLRER
jgi:hypothetical protein